MKLLNLHKKLPAIFVVFLLVVFFTPTIAQARTLDDIQKEIDQKAKELEELNKQVNSAQSKLNNSTAAKNSAQGKLKELETTIAQINDQIEYNKLRTQQLTEQTELKNLEMEVRDEKQDKQIKSSYVSWKTTDYISAFFSSEDLVRTATYYDMITSEEQITIESLANELNKLESDLASFTEEAQVLGAQITSLEEERKAKEAEVAQINATIASEASRLNASRSQANVVASQVDQLNQEQKALQEYEAWILGQSGNGGNQPVQPGEFYFTGRGRDGYQGHGVGLSQNGALGAGLAGWNYRQIVQFYYQGSSVVTYTQRTTLGVNGHGTMDVNDYVSGLGEVPSYGCEDLGVTFGSMGYWGCWPKEAIKAQIVTARSYALNYTRNGASICTTDSCQVYLGGEAKKDLSEETSYEIVAINGQPFGAVYSSQNNQGFGTANNDTVWSNREGVGTPSSYLRAANDNGFYYPATFSGCGGGDCAAWSYRTNSYTMAEIQGMLTWSLTSPSTAITQGDRNFINGVLSNIGTLTSITFERDPSQRVQRIVLTGTNGSRKMGGWFFKSLWNIWVDNVQPSGQKDFIYSLTYFVLQG